MRILIASPLGAGFGVSRVALSWVKALSDLGAQVEVIASNPIEAVEKLELPRGVRLHEACSARAFQESSLGGKTLGQGGALGLWRRAESVARICRKLSRDQSWVISHEAMLSVAIRKESSKARIFSTWHSPVVEEMSLNDWKYASWKRRLLFPPRITAFAALEAQALRSSDVVHTLSHYTWGRLQRIYPWLCTNKQHFLIPGSVDQERFNCLESREEARKKLGIAKDTLLYVGVRRLVPRNGLDRLFPFARSLLDRHVDAKILVAGNGPLLHSLQERSVEMGVTHQIQFLGSVEDSTLRSMYRAADATLMPTRATECFGLPAAESLASGRPVLASPVGALPEVLHGSPRMLAESNTDLDYFALLRRSETWLRKPSESWDESHCLKMAEPYSSLSLSSNLERVFQSLA